MLLLVQFGFVNALDKSGGSRGLAAGITAAGTHLDSIQDGRTAITASLLRAVVFTTGFLTTTSI